MKAQGIIALVLLLVGGGAGSLFVIQNGSRTTQLSLDLFMFGWQLMHPVSVPVLMGLCAGAGLLLGGLIFGARSVRLSSQVRRLERQIALSDQGAEEWPT
jgi:uncharacterized integral membrane protein